jgi:hypothetical protein
MGLMVNNSLLFFLSLIHSNENIIFFLDLAISAPGEKDDIHTGSVYIYLGSRTSKLSKHTQKIVPSQLLNNFKQTTIIKDFGFSLATQSPFNYPKNSSSNSTIIIDYPSLIIGIPKADMIVNLR